MWVDWDGPTCQENPLGATRQFLEKTLIFEYRTGIQLDAYISQYNVCTVIPAHLGLAELLRSHCGVIGMVASRAVLYLAHEIYFPWLFILINFINIARIFLPVPALTQYKGGRVRHSLPFSERTCYGERPI